MSKVTDQMYILLKKAENKDDSYEADLAQIHKRHTESAIALLKEGTELDRFLDTLKSDVQNLQAILRAVYIAGHCTESFSDFIVGHGELWSAQLLAATVRKRGLSCTWMNAWDILVVDPTTPNQVDPDFEASVKKMDAWYSKNATDTIIVTGFIASTSDNVRTTLKRDGSDFSAAIFAALLKAKEVTIWTDVDGVYSADPRKVSEAVILDTLTYQEAWELSYFGAYVLHPRTIMPVMRYDIPITIRNVFNISAQGTKISSYVSSNAETSLHENEPEGCSSVKGFATIDNVALINVEGTGMAGVPGTASEIFGAVKDAGANVIMISQASSEHSVCFAVPQREARAVAKALEEKFHRALAARRLSRVDVIPNCCILAAVGQRMASTPGVSATLFSALAKANINVRAIAQGCSEYNVTIVVDQQDSVRALKAVHSRVYLSKTTMSVGIVGPGLIGGTLLKQLNEQAATLKEEFNIDLRVMGILGSKSMLLDDRAISLDSWKHLLKENGEPADIHRFTDHLRSSNSIPNKVIVDCTASADIAKYYYQWIKKGIHVITPNKKANSGPLDQYLRLRDLQRQSYTHYFYEATVGAGLPIISTLRGLLETGDKILRVEGIFSGTLSYIFNCFNGEKPFSQIVLEAKDSGYTEPDPRDDLSGMDVARKVTILAREIGLKLELENVQPDSLVPEPLREGCSIEEFLNKLPDYDEKIEEMRAEAERCNEVLRYVGIVDVENGKGSVRLERYSRSHPFAQLSGSDNIISFRTKRYNAQPLIVRGPGAGAEVTAGGVFCDILRLASYLGAPS
ncbi:hypothetical protein KP509_10G015100 [Ceratopteris richardii]|nr:hypothetical protein KP509_10G015100 [Ceratopteris richardii]